MAPAKPFHILAVLLASAFSTAAHAQALNQPNPLDRLSDVVQFGVPRDTKFVFCDGEDCPERSIKHLYVPPPPPPPVIEPVMPAPQSVEPPKELSPAKVPVKKKRVKKKRKKPAVQYICKPVTNTK